MIKLEVKQFVQDLNSRILSQVTLTFDHNVSRCVGRKTGGVKSSHLISIDVNSKPLSLNLPCQKVNALATLNY